MANPNSEWGRKICQGVFGMKFWGMRLHVCETESLPSCFKHVCSLRETNICTIFMQNSEQNL